MISIITPTNNPKYLDAIYESLKAQTFQDWEWVIVPNNKAKVDLSARKIRIVPFDKKTNFIGEIKKFAFSQGKGDILLELDHDDILLPTALEKINEVFKDQEVIFAASNSANFYFDHKEKKDWNFPIPYNKAFGWETREIEFEGHNLLEEIGFPITPKSLSMIYFAPNHFRAWRRSAYEEIGGHDPNLQVCDDHDLCCRTYLHGKCIHIDECLYLYRVTGENAWLKFNKEIQNQTKIIRDKYLYSLVKKWCEINDFKKIDLGGALNCPDGYIPIDLESGFDLNKKWPFPDNSIGCIRAHDILEHLKDPIHIMNEIYRVLVPGGWLLSATPSTDGRGAFQDPTHISFWNENSFWYYTDKNYSKYLHGKFKGRFMVGRLKTSSSDIPYVFADLIALKEGMEKMPGEVKI